VNQERRSEPKILAAVDLGSNSFHMVVARLSHGQPKVIDRLREMVRLAAGEDRQEIALDCLSRFGERIRTIHADSVRVVGTSTLRKLGRSSNFVRQASARLGHPVEIISGIEEARLIYQGVIHTSPAVQGNQLVVDIGGGSTEIINGAGLEPTTMESLNLGCVGLSRSFFDGGEISRHRFNGARTAARLELRPVYPRFGELPRERAIGASGTVRAVQAVLTGSGENGPEITMKRLEGLIEKMISVGHLDGLKMSGLSAERKPVFPGGVAILIEIMSALKIDMMDVSDGALREGILYDMVGRLTDEDARVRTVRSVEGRFNIDVMQAGRVEATATYLMDRVSRTWKIDKKLDRQLLVWAARLHEIGLHISHSRYHRHGAYLLENADLPGFPTGEQQILASLVGAHRSKLERKSFAGIQRAQARSAERLAVILRLAVLFNRGRADVDLSELNIRAKGRRIYIEVSRSWLDANPLTWADLKRERKYLDAVGIELTLVKLNHGKAA
jgi:exopolyphosphatase/guanosine-5'-triphosphate,3'-diphosphate pyrophosphatase